MATTSNAAPARTAPDRVAGAIPSFVAVLLVLAMAPHGVGFASMDVVQVVSTALAERGSARAAIVRASCGSGPSALPARPSPASPTAPVAVCGARNGVLPLLIDLPPPAAC